MELNGRKVWLLALLMHVGGVVPLFAQPAPRVLSAGKAAAALVILPDQKGSGSAFCIDRNGLFITNAHVVAGLDAADTVSLVLNPSERGERVLQARVAVADQVRDLAVLIANNAKDLAPLELGDESSLTETQQLTALGFPFGQALALQEGKYASISVNVVRVSSLRKAEGAIELIQIDSQLNPGNSGGPLVDATGKVVGVIQAGILGGGINFAIPVSRLKQLLETPNVAVDLPKVAFSQRNQPVEFAARVVQFAKSTSRMKVQLKLGDGAELRTIDLAPAAGDATHYVARTPPLAPRKGPPRLRVSIEVTGGSVQGTVEDLSLRLGTRNLKLSDISKIERKNQLAVVQLTDGTALDPVTFPSITLGVDVSGTKVLVEMAKVQVLSVSEPESDPDRVRYVVTVSQDGKLLASSEGELIFEPSVADTAAKAQPRASIASGGTNAPATLPTGQPQFAESQLVVKLPEPFQKAALAGAGRYLILYLKEAQTIQILDVLSGEIASEIANISEDVLIAGGRDSLILALPGQKLMQKYSLTTFKREKVAPIPGSGSARMAILGPNSKGPLLIVADDTVFVDIDTMRPITVDGETLHTTGQYGYSIRVSADGTTFGGIIQGLGPVGYSLMQLRGRTSLVAGFESTSNANRWAQPTADGTLILMPGGIVYSRQLWRCDAQWLGDMTLYPTVDPRYFIAVRFADVAGKGAVVHLAICTVADRKIIHTLVGLPEMAPRGNTSARTDYGRRLHFGEERFFFVPWAGVIALLDWDSSRVILHRFDLMQAMEASGVDYLFVDSIPPDLAPRGKTLVYQITTKSKAGKQKYVLETGPKGMSVSADGLVRWSVPATFPDDTAKAVFSISDAGGQEVLHSVELKIVTETRTTTGRDRKPR